MTDKWLHGGSARFRAACADGGGRTGRRVEGRFGSEHAWHRRSGHATRSAGWRRWKEGEWWRGRKRRNAKGMRRLTQVLAGLETEGEQSQITEAAPQGADARQAVALAAEVAAQATDPAYDLLEGRRLGVGGQFGLAEADPQGRPLRLGQD